MHEKWVFDLKLQNTTWGRRMNMNRTVLIVDDNLDSRKILYNILNDDYMVIEAGSGTEAVMELERAGGKVSAILIELAVMQRSHYEFMEQVQHIPHFAGIPVIVTTQKEGVEIEIEVLSKGAADFIPKPCNASVIRHRLKNTINLIETAAKIKILEHDTLTGLYNKEGFCQKVADVLEHNECQTEYDIVCVDIDNFKLINDMYGEKKADALLVYFAGLMEKVSAAFGGISSRISADVFMSFLPGTVDYENDLLPEIQTYLREYAKNFNVTVRFGIYPIDDKSLTVRAMCDRAKLACQSIKGKYGNYFAYYNDELRNHLVLEQEIAIDMKPALLKEEFEVYFQPKYNLLTEKIVGAEALVRWNHPDKGFLSPAEFIPFFEKNGFIIDLDRYVWEKTCILLRKWMDKGYPMVPVSVNVSRVDIYNPRLPDIICDLVEKYEISPDLLHLEITETAYTENPKQLISFVSVLKQKGFAIDMDDFGSEYSSLNMLNELPVDTLKLDMCFLLRKENAARTEDILNFIIHLANRLNLSVVAEGVETGEDFNFLSSMGCQYGQGFYFARPMPVKQFEELICGRDVESAGIRNREPQSGNLNYYELRTLVDYMPGGVFKYRADGEGDFVFVTDTLFRMTGYTREEFENKFQNKFENFVYFEDRARVLAEIKDQITFGEIDYCEYRVETKSGELRWFYDVGHIVIDENGEKWFYVIVVDHTDLKIAQESARMEHESYESILPYTKDVIFEWNIKKDEMICTNTFLHKFGYLPPAKQSIKNMKKEGYIHQEDISKFDEMFDNLKRGIKFASCEVRVQKIDSDFLWCKISATAIKDDLNNIARVIGVITDINDSRILLEGVQKKANYDPLTQLQNRTYFEECVNSYLIQNGNQGAFLMMDLDDFKYVNDTYGHAAGDKVLTALADRLRSSFRAGDYITRMGGDEFAVFMTNIFTKEALNAKLDILRGAINQEIELEGIGYVPSCSVGAIIIPKEGTITFSECYKQADDAMYQSKRNGKNQWHII